MQLTMRLLKIFLKKVSFISRNKGDKLRKFTQAALHYAVQYCSYNKESMTTLFFLSTIISVVLTYTLIYLDVFVYLKH